MFKNSQIPTGAYKLQRKTERKSLGDIIIQQQHCSSLYWSCTRKQKEKNSTIREWYFQQNSL
jgi:hypothetical protein